MRKTATATSCGSTTAWSEWPITSATATGWPSPTPGSSHASAARALAGELVEFALRDMREAGERVLPYCSYVSDYIARNPEFLDLVPEERRRSFGLRSGG